MTASGRASRLFTTKHFGRPGDPYLDRTLLVSTRWFGVYVHHIWREDRDYHPHDHPWPFVTFVLRGGYVEQWHDKPLTCDKPRTFWRGRGSVHAVPLRVAHRIMEVRPRTVTLVIRGRRRPGDAWHFYPAISASERVAVPWRDYLGLPAPSDGGESGASS